MHDSCIMILKSIIQYIFLYDKEEGRCLSIFLYCALSRPKILCCSFTAAFKSLPCTNTQMFVWLSADCKIFTPELVRASVTLDKTPGTPFMPAPTADTLAQFSVIFGSYCNDFRISTAFSVAVLGTV